MRVVVIHPHPIVQNAFHELIRSLVPEAEVHAIDDLSRCPNATEFDRAILDVSQSGGEPHSSPGEFRKRFPGVPFLIVSSLPRSGDPSPGALAPEAAGEICVGSDMRTIRAGVAGLLGIDRPVGAGAWPPAAVQTGTASRRPQRSPVNLTPRQADVLQLLLHGLSNKRISRQLGLSPSTVKIHVSAVLRALDVRTRTEAVVAVDQRGLGLHAVRPRPGSMSDGTAVPIAARHAHSSASPPFARP